MSPLLAPVFAQLLTLHAGDRTEGRYVDYEQKIYEAATTPFVALNLQLRRTSVDVYYSPSITVTPLEEAPRDVLTYHQTGASVGHTWSRNTLRLSSSFGFGDQNFAFGTLRNQPQLPASGGTPDAPDAEPDAGDGTPTPPDTTPPGPEAPDLSDPANGQLDIRDVNVRYYDSHTLLSGSRQFSREVSAEAHVGHMQAGGLDEASIDQYPVYASWFAGITATYTYGLSAYDSFLTTGSIEQSWSPTYGTTAQVLMLTEGWQHVFNKRTFAGLTAGISVTRFTDDTGLEGFSIYPTFQAGLVHGVPLGGGQLSLAIYAYSAPQLDPLRALVDPRLGGGGSINYTRKRLSLGVDGNVAVSIAPADYNQGAISSANAQAIAAYALSEVVSVDAGVRYTRQNVEGAAVIPSSWAAFVGLVLVFDAPLLGSSH